MVSFFRTIADVNGLLGLDERKNEGRAGHLRKISSITHGKAREGIDGRPKGEM